MSDGVLLLTTKVDLTGTSGLNASLNDLGGTVNKLNSHFDEVSSKSRAAGRAIEEAGKAGEYSMMEARHSVMILGEEFGAHLPRALTSFIASLGPVGPALEAAFPFLAIILGATLLIEHFSKLGEAAKAAGEAGAKAFESQDKALEEATAKSLELQVKIAELTGGPTTALEAKLQSVKAILASMHLAPELKGEFEDLIKSIQIPSNWNPLNWFGDSVAASKEVKAEAQSAQLAISNAATLQDKQSAATQELTRAQLELSRIQKSGSDQAIEDQNKLIRFLEGSKQLIDSQIGAQKDAATVSGIEQANKDYEAQKKIYDEQQRGLEQRRKAEEEYSKHQTELHKKEAKEVESMKEDELRATEAVNAIAKKNYDEQLDSLEKIALANSKIATERIKTTATGDSAGVKEQAQLGIITKEQESAKLAEIERRELSDLKVIHGQELAEMQQHLARMQAAQSAAKGGGGEAEATKAATEAQIRLNEAKANDAREEQAIYDEILKNQAATQKLQYTWASFFTQMKENLPPLGAEIRKELQDSTTKFVDGFSQGIAKCIVESKNLGVAMRQLASQIIEQLIEMTVKWLILEAVQKLFGQSAAGSGATKAIAQNATVAESDAGVAAAAAFAGTMVKTLGDVPASLAAAIAADAIAQTFVAQASAAGGWDVPSGGPHAAILHSREMVLPAPLAEGVRSMTEKGGGGKESNSTSTQNVFNMHFVYSPQNAEANPREHGEEAFAFIKSKFLRMGYSV